MPAGIWYCNRESVKSALDEMETARSNAQIDDAIEFGARDVDGLCARQWSGFAPLLATRRYDFPSRTGRSPSWRLWLDAPLISASSVTTDGGATTLTAAQYNLEPNGSGPPYNRIEIDLGDSGSFSSASTFQQAIAVTGLWGWTAEQRAIGSLSSNLAASTSATASLAWTTARFGVGDILLIDSERIVISDRNFVDSTQNLGGNLLASDADVSVSVTDGTAYATEEIILIGSERMRIVDIVGNVLTVKRAWDGSQLAAHSATADIYALTGVELTRAALGTTLAAHSSGAVVYRWIAPGPLATLNRAYALNALVSERSAWARVLSAGSDTAVELTGRGLAKLETDVERIYGQRARTRAIV